MRSNPLFAILLFLSGILFLSNSALRPTISSLESLRKGMYVSRDSQSGVFSQVFYDPDSLQLMAYQSCFAGECHQNTFWLTEQHDALVSEDSLTEGVIKILLVAQSESELSITGLVYYPDAEPQRFYQRFDKE